MSEGYYFDPDGFQEQIRALREQQAALRGVQAKLHGLPPKQRDYARIGSAGAQHAADMHDVLLQAHQALEQAIAQTIDNMKTTKQAILDNDEDGRQRIEAVDRLAGGEAV
jgi:hypothetical protein